MKLKATLYTSLALCSLSLASCSDKDVIDNGQPLPAGTEIQFGTALDSNLDSRTYYDPADVANPDATAWKIYWNYQANDFDKIFIYSPEAAEGRNQATYTVDPEGQDKYQATKVTKDGAAGIQTGDGDGNYNFYALYPASAVTGTAANGVINATFNGRQNLTNLQPTQSSSNTVYTIEADMNNCLMTAVNTTAATNLSKGVSLQFEPFASVLNIEVNGPITGQEVVVSSLKIESENQISGDFSIDFSSGQPVVNANSTLPADKNIYINLEKDVTLKHGDKLNVRVFVLPNTNVDNLTVTVTSNTSRSWGKKLNMTSFAPKQIHSCKLPQLDNTTAKFDYSIWLSQLPPETYISEISLPGAALSFNTAENNVASNLITQSLDVQKLFQAGIRAFQAHITLNSNISSPIDQGASFVIAGSNGTATNMTLYDILQTLVSEMEQNHGDEFCVLLLSDYGWGSGMTASDFYKRLQVITNAPEFKSKLITDFGPNTTIAQAQGKIILKYQLNISSFDGVGTSMDNAFNSINEWAPLNGSQVAFNWWNENVGSRVGYSPLVYSNVGNTVSLASSSNSTKPAFNTPYDANSLIYMTAYKKWYSANWGRYTTLGSYRWLTNGQIDMFTLPSSMDTGMWFIYGEQANAGDNQSDVNKNITNVVNAIASTYNSSTRNKFYMTYCGGAPNSRDLTTMTDLFNATWTTAVRDKTNMPWGWVMLNGVGGIKSTSDVITTIIEHNSIADGFTPGTATAPVNYTGSAGATNGGQLND